jgi:hypothetical protein
VSQNILGALELVSSGERDTMEQGVAIVELGSDDTHGFLITGDFNLYVDDSENSNAKQFLTLLDSCNLTQLVNFPFHHCGHTLDLIITATNSTLSSVISHSQISPFDHFPIFC